MEFKINRLSFARVLNSVIKLIPPKSTHTVLQNIILEAQDNTLSIEGTDLDIFVKKNFHCDVKKAGKILLQGKKLLEIVQESNTDELIFKQKELILQISAGNAQFNIPTLDYREFPEIPTFPSREWFKISSEEFSEMVDSTVFMVSRDLSKRAMNGVFVRLKENMLNLVTTDGARLALYRKDIKGENGELIVPPKLFELFDINQPEEIIEIYIEERMIGLKFVNTTIIARLIEGPYPNYEGAMPKVFAGTCVIEKRNLEGAVKRVSLVSNPRVMGVRFDFMENNILLSSSSPDFGEAQENVCCNYDGEKMAIWFNAAFLLEIIRHIKKNEVNFQLTSPSTAALIRPNGDDKLIYLLMPLRIDTYE